jgi:hypothetical protein
MCSIAHAIIATALALPVPIPTTLAAPQDAKPDFSGTWVMERKVTPDGPTSVLLIKHKDPSFVVEWRSELADWSSTFRTDFTTDGKENSTTLPIGPVMTSRSKWDGKELVIVSSVYETAESATYRWALSGDQRILTLSIETAGPQGPTRGKFVYTRR